MVMNVNFGHYQNCHWLDLMIIGNSDKYFSLEDTQLPAIPDTTIILIPMPSLQYGSKPSKES